MPRVTLASEAQINNFTDKIRRLTAVGYINERERTRAEMLLSEFAVFPDKAFKAFYARKILRIPPVIAAEVFNVSNGLISQAASDRNVYTARNAEGMDDDLERGYFMIPNVQGRHGESVGNGRQNIFRNMAYMVIYKNRGVDVPNFQNRMVASFMSETAADELRESMQRFAPIVAAQFSQPETATTLEISSTPTSEASPTSAGTTDTREEAIQLLINEGTDRDRATSVIMALANRNYNPSLRVTPRGMITMTLMYVGSRGDTTNVDTITNIISSRLRVQRSDILSNRVQGVNYILRFRLRPAEENTAPSQTEENTAPSQSDIVYNVEGFNPRQRKVLRLDEEPTRATEILQRFAEMGYSQSNVYRVLNFLADYRLFIFKINANTQGGTTVTRSEGDSYRSTPFSIMDVQDQNSDVTVSRFRTARWVNFLRQNLISGLFPGTRSNNNQGRQRVTFRRRMGVTIGFLHLPNLRRVEEINGGTSETPVSQPQSTPTPLPPVDETLRSQYNAQTERFRSGIDFSDFKIFREAGYRHSDVVYLVMFVLRYGLTIRRVTKRARVGQSPEHLRIDVRGTSSDSSTFRNSTFLNFMRSRLTDLGNTDEQVQVLAPQGRPYQSATFRGTGRGRTPIGVLILPLGSNQTQTATSAPSASTETAPFVRNRGENPSNPIRFVGYQYADRGRLFRSGSLPFRYNTQVRESGSKSYMLYWWSDMNERFYQLAAGPMDLRNGEIIPIFDTLNQISQTTPGKLKLYSNNTVNAMVANAVRIADDDPSFVPQRIQSGTQTLELNVADYGFFNEPYARQRTARLLQIENATRVDVTTGQVQAAASTVTEQQATQVSQMSFTNTLGFEFEGGGSNSRQQTAQILTRLGVPCNFEGYNHTTRAQWKIVTDATLGGVQNGMELVSPILTGEEGLKNLGKCLRATQEAGMFIHEQGGVHIHMGNQDWDLQHRKNILLNQVKVQKFFLKTIPQYREDMARQWARPFDTNRSFSDRVRNASSIQQLAMVTGTRYMLINITNTRQPTWEWRYPTGSLEVDTNVYSARLIDKLVQVSKFGELPSNMASGDGMKKWMSQDIFSFWRNRIYELSQTKGSTRRPESNL